MKNNILLTKTVDESSEKIVNIVNSLDGIKDFSNAFSDRIKDRKVGRSQLSNLLNSARTANSVEELKLFIKYQESRYSNWAQRVGNKTLAEQVIEKINEVMKLAEEAETLHPELNFVELKLKMAEKFLGYLYWKGTVYAKGGED